MRSIFLFCIRRCKRQIFVISCLSTRPTLLLERLSKLVCVRSKLFLSSKQKPLVHRKGEIFLRILRTSTSNKLITAASDRRQRRSRNVRYCEVIRAQILRRWGEGCLSLHSGVYSSASLRLPAHRSTRTHKSQNILERYFTLQLHHEFPVITL